MRCRSYQVGVAEAAEDAERIVAWRRAEEQVMQRDGICGVAGASVEEERRRVQRLGPEGQLSCTVD